LLGQALTKWSEVRDQLNTEGLPQSEIACRLSLLSLCSKLTELKAVFAALEVANPDGIPIQVLIDTVRSKANGYSSLRGANSEVSVLAEGYTLVAHHEQSGKSKPKGRPGYRTKECNLWLRGECSYGENCIFKHTGAAGQGSAGASLADDLGAQVRALQAQVKALQGKKCNNNNNLTSSKSDKNRSTAASKLENQDSLSRFNSPDMFDALSVSHEVDNNNKDGDTLSVALNNQSNNNNNNNISDEGYNALSVLCNNNGMSGINKYYINTKFNEGI
jgi:hypothetical protein